MISNKFTFDFGQNQISKITDIREQLLSLFGCFWYKKETKNFDGVQVQTSD
jgi:hypothetical protein